VRAMSRASVIGVSTRLGVQSTHGFFGRAKNRPIFDSGVGRAVKTTFLGFLKLMIRGNGTRPPRINTI
jgi:hypothetical protein